MKVVIISSDGNCGIYEYSQILLEGFRLNGYEVRYLGVQKQDDRSLAQAIRQVRPDEKIVIFEYEAGIFRLPALVRAMLKLRLVKRKGIVLSIHELELSKFPEYQSLMARLGYRVRQSLPVEMLRLLKMVAGIGGLYARLRLLLLLFGAIPNVLVVHSRKAEANMGLVWRKSSKIKYVPHVVKQLSGDKMELRCELQLPREQFTFVVPGFLFRRKRIVEVVNSLPAEMLLLVVGTESAWDPGYLKEIQEAASRRRDGEVRIIQDYENMEKYLLASDVVVLFYSDVYQSGIACLALGASKPCIFSELEAFEPYRGAGIFVRDGNELGPAMVAIQDKKAYDRFLARAQELREEFKPQRVAAQYLH